MAYINADIKLPEAGRTVTVRLYFPTDLPSEVGNKVKGVITLLHGFSNTSNDWFLYSAACRYAADNGYILVAPNAENSFYSNMAYGSPWYAMLTEMLPAQLDKIFHIPRNRDINYIAGLSMGGYGALRIGLSHPERYAAIGSFSGVVDVAAAGEMAKTVPEVAYILSPVLGPELAVTPDIDPFALAAKVAALPKQQQPGLYITCGKQDNDANRIHDQNLHLVQHLKDLSLPFTYEEWDGVHEWNFWDRSIAQFIGFIQNSGYGKRKIQDWNTPSTLVEQA